VVPDEGFNHLVSQVDSATGVSRPACPQLGILEIRGDLYFGAAPRVEDAILQNLKDHPDQRFLLLRMLSVTQIDISGVHMLESVVRTYRERGGDVFLVRVQPQVMAFMQSTDFDELLGADHFLDEDTAISYLFYRVLDPAICIYECDVRVFKECQNLPKHALPPGLWVHTDIPADGIPTVSPRSLWAQLRSQTAPAIYDVREPREYHQGHVPHAQSIPLAQMLTASPPLPRDRPIVLTCRTGRRSARAAYVLRNRGYDNVSVLEGGVQAWEADGLLEAVDVIPQDSAD
jgi:sulfate permease, SulP family